ARSWSATGWSPRTGGRAVLEAHRQRKPEVVDLCGQRCAGERRCRALAHDVRLEALDANALGGLVVLVERHVWNPTDAQGLRLVGAAGRVDVQRVAAERRP